ncbi:MAG: hypothetical protein CVU59_12670 [Deltaproteobacteria bacterium HGW-Deltaproteobacteria-17]|nr:MAG: hypothetical protein CVU59_12670 [Deltaproteobacteria bacterium HGW-Deltaproteobacteria-17]
MTSHLSVCLLFTMSCLLACEPAGRNANNGNNVNNTNNLSNVNNANNLTDGGTDADGAADTGPDADVDASTEPWVQIVSPADGAVVDNPVTFTIAAGRVAMVRLFADDWPLGDAWDPAGRTTHTYDFSGTGYERNIVLRGYADTAATVEVATDSLVITPRETDVGTFLSDMWNTYYYLAMESDYSGADDTTLYDANCAPIAQVPADFSDDVCIEGSGRLDDGRVINYARSCNCGRTCPTGGIICYAVLDAVEFPWGMGSASNPLEPLRSWAVDSSFIARGTLLYAEEFDGVTIPAVDGLGGFVHDGCFRADDVGGWINGNHFDFFAGTHDMWIALENLFPTESTFNVYINPGKCAYLAQ